MPGPAGRRSTSTRLGPFERERLPSELRRHDPETLAGVRGRPAVRRPWRRRPAGVRRSTDANAGDVAGDRRPPRRRAARDRARRRARPVPDAGRDPRAARGPARPPRRRRAPTSRSASDRCAARSRGATTSSSRRRGACSSASSVFGGRLRPRRRREAVAGGAASWAMDVLDGLAALVDQSLLRQRRGRRASRGSRCSSRSASSPRSGSARDAARPRRSARAPRARVPRRSRARVAARARRRAPAGRARPARARARQPARRDRLGATPAADAEVALGIGGAVWRFWQKRGYLREARARVAAARRPCRGSRRRRPRLPSADARGPGRDRLLARRDRGRATATTRRRSRSGARMGDRAEIANALYNLSFCFTMDILSADEPAG